MGWVEVKLKSQSFLANSVSLAIALVALGPFLLLPMKYSPLTPLTLGLNATKHVVDAPCNQTKLCHASNLWTNFRPIIKNFKYFTWWIFLNTSFPTTFINSARKVKHQFTITSKEIYTIYIYVNERVKRIHTTNSAKVIHNIGGNYSRMKWISSDISSFLLINSMISWSNNMEQY